MTTIRSFSILCFLHCCNHLSSLVCFVLFLFLFLILLRMIFKQNNKNIQQNSSELVHYGSPPAGFVEEFGLTSIQHLLRDCSTRPEPTSGDNAMRVTHQGGELIRYPFYDSWEVNPPYCLNPPPKVRSYDWVWVVAEQQLCCEKQLLIERFWYVLRGHQLNNLHCGPSLPPLKVFSKKKCKTSSFCKACFTVGGFHNLYYSNFFYRKILDYSYHFFQFSVTYNTI